MSLLRSFLHRHSIVIPPRDLLSQSLSRSSEGSSTVSPSFDSVSESSDEEEKKDTGYFERDYTYSPEPYGSDSDEESDGAESDATLDDTDLSKFGYPLERIPRPGDGDGIFISDSDDQEFGHGVIYHPGTPCSSSCTSLSQSFSSVTSSLTDCQAIVEDLLSEDPFDGLDPQNFITYDPSPSTSLSSLYESPLMIKRSARASAELSLFLELNSADLRNDPWNPCPHILQIVDHDPESEYLYLCMERLHEFNAPPMTTVAQYIDFFRQILEGLSFLHEHGLVGFSCSDPGSYMVDLSSGPQSRNGSSTSLLSATISRGRAQDTSTPLKSHSGNREHSHNRHHHHHHHHHHPAPAADARSFDRSMYPVRYYFVNFTHARRIQDTSVRERATSVSSSSTPPPSKHPLPPKQVCPFKQDVGELGLMIDRMLSDVPSVVSVKFKALIKAMTTGGFGAEDSRKLFEALIRSLEAGVFDLPVKAGSGGVRSQSVDVSLSGMTISGFPCSSCKFKEDRGVEPDTVVAS